MVAITEEQADFLLSCRYGELDEAKQYIEKFGSDSLLSIHDDNGSNCLHMSAGNGHDDVLDLLLPLIPPDGLLETNNSLSTPLHWAALNGHLTTIQKLVNHSPGPGVNLIDQKNKAGRTPLSEAEMAGWEGVARWMVSVMNLTTDSPELVDVEDGDDEELQVDGKEDIEVEIQDADGGVARMTLGKDPTAVLQSATRGETSENW